MIVERSFMPCTISKNFTTHPFAWQTKPFQPEVTDFKNWTYVILEVAVDSVTPAVFQIENLDGSFVQSHWTRLDLALLALDEETGCQLAMLTGLRYRQQKFPSPKSYWKNFPDADKIDRDPNRPRPRREVVDAKTHRRDDEDEVAGAQVRARHAAAKATNTKVTIDSGDNKENIVAFLYHLGKDLKIDSKVNPNAPASKTPQDDRQRPQFNKDAMPRRSPMPLGRIDLKWPTQ